MDSLIATKAPRHKDLVPSNSIVTSNYTGTDSASLPLSIGSFLRGHYYHTQIYLQDLGTIGFGMRVFEHSRLCNFGTPGLHELPRSSFAFSSSNTVDGHQLRTCHTLGLLLLHSSSLAGPSVSPDPLRTFAHHAS
ncbi:hypothetical protein AC579_9998 [Pseudocercospora musae]|uniref:Uncharacterized protein n=1 Tax=Pseudocercospora musae TaxID=113226 RepID=A0A139I4V1_9PEZI|nr:hypothetical protein AC579_9998 [Pseudocercospora musae]